MLGLSNHLIALCGKEPDIQTPPRNFVIFLQIILAFVDHPSVCVNQGGVSVWLQLAKHDLIAKDSLFINSIRPMIEIIAPKTLKRPFPKHPQSISSTSIPHTPEAYACLEFDGEEDYFHFLHRLRVDFLDVFRQATLIAPLYTFSYCEGWLNRRIELSHKEIRGHHDLNIVSDDFL